MTSTPPPDSPRSLQQATPVDNPVERKRSRRFYVLWAVALSTLLALGLICWKVVVPVWHAQTVLSEHVVSKPDPGHILPTAPEEPYLVTFWDPMDVISELGGQRQAFRKLSLYLRIPARWATRKHEAIYLLGSCGEAAVPLLCNRLKDHDPWSRELAAAALGRLGADAQDAIPSLEGLIQHDPSDEVRSIGIGALEKIKAAQEKKQ